MPRPEKEQAVAVLEERFKRAKALVFANFQGLSSAQIVELRREFRKNQLEYYVIKNTMARRAAERAGLHELSAFFVGPTGVCISYEDPARAFQLAHRMAQKFEKYQIKGGVLEGATVPAQEVEVLASLPTRPELLAQLAGVLQGPVQQLAGALHRLIQQLPGVLAEVQKKKEKEAEEKAGAQVAAPPPASAGGAST
jgi:large subunit ribosomal protein L10